uniref:EF-hand domain-containing protein n=1 Tax=Syphacia muris TaxID=451379 RepID=A0A158R5R9_9BILA
MSSEILDDENVHVKELNRLFLSCARNGETYLDAVGLRTLCEKLNLVSFSDEIIERVLNGFHVVQFSEFKDRFVQLLPEIIDISTNAESIEQLASNNLNKINVISSSRISRQQIHLLCQITPELDRLTSLDVDNLFDCADPTASEFVSLTQFLKEFKKRKRLSQEVNFINETFIPAVNLFESIDPECTGIVDCRELLQHWATCGISTEHGVMVLKQTGQPHEGSVDAVALSGRLEKKLGDLASGPSASLVVRVALVSLHAFIDHLRCLVKEGSSRTDHLYKQLQVANQRRNLLIEELEQNQTSLEEGYELRLKESEDRFKLKINQMGERYLSEKKDLMKELEQAEEELSRVRQTECTSRNRLQLLERQCARLKEEATEMASTIQQLKQLNRQLRQELKKIMSNDNSNLSLMWRQRVELLLTHNKCLREKVDEMTKNQNRKPVMVKPLCSHWTKAFRAQYMAMRKLRENRENKDTLSEMESEFGPIFNRTHKRRLLKYRERKSRYERSSSDVEDGSGKSFRKSLDVQKLHALVEKAKLEEVKKLKEEHRREVEAFKVSANEALTEALANQAKQLNEKFGEERKQFGIRLEYEKNELERKFVKERAELIDRLQEELSRMKLSTSSAVNASNAFKYGLHNTEVGKSCIRSLCIQLFLQALEANLQTQQAGSGDKIRDLKDEFAYQFDSLCTSIPSADSSRNFYNLLKKIGDEFDNCISNQLEETVLCNNSTLKSSLLSRKDKFEFAKCGRCELVDSKLEQLQSSFTCDGNITESGIEDLGSSADSSPEEKAKLKQENKKLRDRLESFKKKVIDLRSLLELQSGKLNRYIGIMGGSECSDLRLARDHQQLYLTEGRVCAQCQYLVLLVNHLEVKNDLLNARLVETREMVKFLVMECRKKLEEISCLGSLFQQVLVFQSLANVVTTN